MSARAIHKVLLVDDDADLRRLGKLSLSKVGGWQVLVAASGQEALDLAWSDPPDVVLLDVSMPGMDGPTVLQRLRADPRTATVPVVFITARALPDEIRSLVAAGALGVITKPFDTMKLPSQVAELVSASAPVASATEPLPAGLDDALAAQRAAYVANLPRRVELLAASLEETRANPQAPAIEAARSLAHKLRGSAGSHGLAAVSDAAGRVEEALRGHADWTEIDPALAALRAELLPRGR